MKLYTSERKTKNQSGCTTKRRTIGPERSRTGLVSCKGGGRVSRSRWVGTEDISVKRSCVSQDHIH